METKFLTSLVKSIHMFTVRLQTPFWLLLKVQIGCIFDWRQLNIQLITPVVWTCPSLRIILGWSSCLKAVAAQMSSGWKKQDKSLILLMREEFLGFLGEQRLSLNCGNWRYEPQHKWANLWLRLWKNNWGSHLCLTSVFLCSIIFYFLWFCLHNIYRKHWISRCSKCVG